MSPRPHRNTMQDRPEIRVWLAPEMHGHLRRESDYRGVSLSDYVRQLVVRDMEHQGPTRRRPIPQP
jgi:hypothetical protein